jgi:hypothetical protein
VYQKQMRKFIATLLALFFVMASLPLQSVLADYSGMDHSETSMVVAIDDEASVDCCEMPMSSGHHGNMNCSMDCPALVAMHVVLHVQIAVQFSIASNDDRITQTASAHFRPPIFA